MYQTCQWPRAIRGGGRVVAATATRCGVAALSRCVFVYVFVRVCVCVCVCITMLRRMRVRTMLGRRHTGAGFVVCT